MWCDHGEVLSLPSMGLSCLAEIEVDRMTPEVWLEQSVHEEMKGQRGLDHRWDEPGPRDQPVKEVQPHLLQDV